LKDLKSLQTLNLGATPVTNAGLKELKGLQSLNLIGTKVTDAGLKELKEIKRLQNLDLTGTKVTDAGLKELKELKGLEVLRLRATPVTDAGVKELQTALPKLFIIRQSSLGCGSARRAARGRLDDGHARLLGGGECRGAAERPRCHLSDLHPVRRVPADLSTPDDVTSGAWRCPQPTRCPPRSG